MPSKRLSMNKLNFDEIKIPIYFMIQDFFYIFQVLMIQDFFYIFQVLKNIF